jgi:hypothetical protein
MERTDPLGLDIFGIEIVIEIAIEIGIEYSVCVRSGIFLDVISASVLGIMLFRFRSRFGFGFGLCGPYRGNLTAENLTLTLQS